jgi:hypothetical protein
MTEPTNPDRKWPDPDIERAQPGDVLGIERAGETTNLGDTAESEDSRRKDSVEKAAELDEAEAEDREDLK